MIQRASSVIALAAILGSGVGMTTAHAAGEPTIARAVTGDNGDGHLDSVTLTFSSTMDGSSPSSSWFASTPEGDGFYVAGYSIIGATWVAGGAPNTALRLNLTPLPIFDTGATPAVHYRPVANGPRSSTTAMPLAPTNPGGVNALDGAGPVLVSATAVDVGTVNLFNSVGDQLALGFSEPVHLAGVGHTRAANLENVLRFTGIAAEGSNGCPLDGTATGNQNLPQQSVGDSPVSPASPTEASGTLTVTQKAGNVPSLQRFVGVPRGCSIGIDPSNTSFITDGAGNVSRAHNAIAGKSVVARVEPRAITLVEAKTTDGTVSIPDGVADGIQLVFSGPITDSTFDALKTAGSVSIAGNPVDIAQVLTAQTPNDETVALDVSIPAAASVSSIVVSYGSPGCTHSANGTNTAGVTGPVKYGAPYAACVAGFSSGVTDGVGPAVIAATTLDADQDGRVDGAAVKFSEPVDKYAAAGWTLGHEAVQTFTVDAEDKSLAVLAIAASETPNGGELPELSYAAGAAGPTSDAAGNSVPAATWPTSDGVGPAVMSATAEDLDGDGHVDAIHATLSEPSTVAEGTTLAFGDVLADSMSANGTELTATLTGFTGGASKPITLSEGIADLGGVALASSTFDGVVDLVAPVGRVSVSPSAPIPAGNATVAVTYTEAMASDLLNVTFDGMAISPIASPNHTNGWRTDDPSTWEGNLNIADDACAVSTGCPVAIEAVGGADRAGVLQAQTARLDTFVDTMAPDAGTIAVIRSVGSSAPSGYVNADATNLKVTVDVPAGQADGGTIEVLIDGGSMNIPFVAEIPDGATSVVLESSYEDADSFREALGGEGEHELSVEVCDAATNCALSDAAPLTVDTIAVPITLNSVEEDRILSGGSLVALDWEIGTGEPVTVSLDYLRGKKWMPIARGLAPEDGFDWKLPKINAEGVRVRAATFDSANNSTKSVSLGTLTIDTSRPTIKQFSVQGGRNLEAGENVIIRWLVKDLTIDQARKQIVLKMSTDGRRWKVINGGKGGTKNDGVQAWRVPKGKGRTYLRILAIDATGKTSSKVLDMTRR